MASNISSRWLDPVIIRGATSTERLSKEERRVEDKIERIRREEKASLQRLLRKSIVETQTDSTLKMLQDSRATSRWKAIPTVEEAKLIAKRKSVALDVRVKSATRKEEDIRADFESEKDRLITILHVP